VSGVGHPRYGDGGSISRREFLRRSAAAGVALPTLSAILAACGGSSTSGTGGEASSGALQLARPDSPVTLPLYDDIPAIADGLKPETGPLRIYNWNDYIYKKVLNRFEDEFGVKIEYTQFTGMSEAISKIQSGTVSFDLFFPTIENVGKLVAAKLIQPLNHSYLPNFQQNIWPSLQDPFYDRGARYSVPYMTWKTGIGYRADQVPDPGKLAAPLDAFWDPKYAGKIGVLNEYRETLGYAGLHLGTKDPFNTTDASAIDTAKEYLLKLVPLKVDVAGSDYQMLADGSSWLHLSWSGNMNYTRWYLPKDTPVTALGYYYPPQGGWEVSNDVIVISSEAKNPVLAHTFMNFLMDIDVGLTNFGYEGYQPPFQNIDEQHFMKAGYIPQNLANTLVRQEDFDTGQRVLAIPPSADQLWQDAWAAFQAGV
jgi:spermidine/putrescine transport system substrate-binding protein